MKNYVKATKIYIFLLNNFFYTPHQNYLKGDKNKAQFVGVKNNIVLSKIMQKATKFGPSFFKIFFSLIIKLCTKSQKLTLFYNPH